MTYHSKRLAAGFVPALVMSAGIAYAATPTAAIKVSDQKMAGEAVTIADVTLPKDGFLVIHPSDAKGNLIEKTIGEVALKTGDHKAVTVKLTEKRQPGDKLWAMLHEDTGTKGVYEFGMPGKTNVDLPIKDKGKVVEEAFKLK